MPDATDEMGTRVGQEKKTGKEIRKRKEGEDVHKPGASTLRLPLRQRTCCVCWRKVRGLHPSSDGGGGQKTPVASELAREKEWKIQTEGLRWSLHGRAGSWEGYQAW